MGGLWIIITHLDNRRLYSGKGSDFILAVELSNTLVAGSYLPNSPRYGIQNAGRSKGAPST